MLIWRSTFACGMGSVFIYCPVYCMIDYSINSNRVVEHIYTTLSVDCFGIVVSVVCLCLYLCLFGGVIQDVFLPRTKRFVVFAVVFYSNLAHCYYCHCRTVTSLTYYFILGKLCSSSILLWKLSWAFYPPARAPPLRAAISLPCFVDMSEGVGRDCESYPAVVHLEHIFLSRGVVREIPVIFFVVNVVADRSFGWPINVLPSNDETAEFKAVLHNFVACVRALA